MHARSSTNLMMSQHEYMYILLRIHALKTDPDTRGGGGGCGGRVVSTFQRNVRSSFSPLPFPA